MGYYLPITDYAGQQYRKRIDGEKKSPYHIERKYRIILDAVKRDEHPNQSLLYMYARRKEEERQIEDKKRFSLNKGMVKGKGERVNVQA